MALGRQQGSGTAEWGLGNGTPLPGRTEPVAFPASNHPSGMHGQWRPDSLHAQRPRLVAGPFRGQRLSVVTVRTRTSELSRRVVL